MTGKLGPTLAPHHDGASPPPNGTDFTKNHTGTGTRFATPFRAHLCVSLAHLCVSFGCKSKSQSLNNYKWKLKIFETELKFKKSCQLKTDF